MAAKTQDQDHQGSGKDDARANREVHSHWRVKTKEEAEALKAARPTKEGIAEVRALMQKLQKESKLEPLGEDEGGYVHVINPNRLPNQKGAVMFDPNGFRTQK